MHIQYNDIIQSPAMLMSQHAVGQLILNAFKSFFSPLSYMMLS